MDFEKAIRPLGRFTPMLEKVPQAVRDAVFDIRISVDKPVLLCCGDRILFLREDGDTAQYFSQNNVTATREDVEEIFLRLCGYSVYSHMEEIRGGFVSADHALRVGIGGTAVIEKGGIKTVRDVTSLSVRIPREKRGCAEEVLRYGVDLSRGLLLAGAPSSGKTTLLRDIARYIGTAGHRVVVLDERFELSADGFDLGACTDILQGYPKQEGLSHAVRCLSPEYIVCDELGENDFSAIRAASFSGVALIASIHAGSVHELCCRPLCRGILSLGAFETVALLHGRSAPTKVEKLFLAGILIVLCAVTAGSSVSARLKMREKELNIFLEALFALKNAAAYTAGDLYALLSLCRENAFLRRVWVLSENMDCTAAFKAAAHAFFTYRGDEALCAAFIDGFGKTDLDGQMAYFALHEGRVRSALLAAEQSLAQKGRLCVALGLFVGVSAALILL